MGLPAVAAEQALQGTVHRVAEWTFASEKTYADPFNEVELDLLITAPDKTVSRVPAFWAGAQKWRVRFAPTQAGVHRFRTECSDAKNPLLHGVEGTLAVSAYLGTNAFYRHGPVRVAANRRHFEHADGTPFLWLADTWWMGFCNRLHWPEEFQALTADRVAKGFNVVQIVAGLYPDMPAFDARGANEAGYPWTRDYSRVEPAYFDEADKRIAWLSDAGIAPCVVGAWGYHLPWLGVERMKKHWRYLVARWSAYPVFWCVAGEGMMPYYLSSNKTEDRSFQKKGWTEVARYLRTIDPYHHPVSIHPTDAARNQVEDAGVLDFDMLQTGHSDRASIPSTINLVRASRIAQPAMPTINSEVCYEGILGTCFEDIQRFMVWSCLLSGTAGHTYGANGIWQVNRREQPYGKSPHGGNWGNTPWNEAMALPGSQQMAWAKRFLEKFEWTRFEPHPEWASYSSTNLTTVKWGSWIWFPEGNPAVDAPVDQPRFFRRTFELPSEEIPTSAVLRLSADDKFTAYLNGELIGSHKTWKPPIREFNVTAKLQRGKNIIAVRADNVAAAVPANPAGLICDLEITLESKSSTASRRMNIQSDTNWLTLQREEPGWTTLDFADQDWVQAMAVAKYGAGPWGEFEASTMDRFHAPYAAGIPGQVRVIYFPLAQPAVFSQLEPGQNYRAVFFNPITGETSAAGSVNGNKNGTALVPGWPRGGQDWVLVLRREQGQF